MTRLARLRALIGLRHFRRHRAQLLLALLGVATGVAAVVAVGLARSSVQRAFDASLAAVSGIATHRIEAPDAGLVEEAYLELRRSAAWIPMAPRITLTVSDAEGRPWTLLGVDLVREVDFQRAGSDWEGATDFPSGGWFAGEPLVLLPEGSGSDDGSWIMQLGDEVLEARVAGHYATRGPGAARVVVADIGRVQEWARMPGRLHAIDVIADPPALAYLRAALREGLQLTPLDEDGAGLTRAFDLNLLALSLLTALVGAFIVFNTFNFLVLQRLPLFQLEHRLGVGPASQRRQVLIEALLVGISGALAGLAFGLVLARFTLGLTRRTVTELYFDASAATLVLDPLVLGAGFAVGVVGCVLAAAGPALRLGPSKGSALSRRLLVGLMMLPMAAGLGLLLVPTGLLGGLAGVFLLALGYAGLGAPLLSALVEPAVRRAALGPRPLLALTLRRLPRTLDRMLPAVTALTLAVATVVGVGTMIASFRTSVAHWLEQSLSADYYVSAERGVLERSWLDQARALPAVEEMATLHRAPARLQMVETELVAVDLIGPVRASYELLAGDPGSAFEALATTSAMVLSETLARATGLGPGDLARVELPAGTLELEVAGVAVDYRAGTGRILVSRRTLERLLGPRPTTSVGFYLASGADVAALEEQLRPLLRGRTALRFSDTRSILAESMAIFDRTFEVTRALQWISAVVALVGLTGALLALQLDRRAELRLLDALGVDLARRRRGLRLEAGLIGATVGVFALPLGALLAWSLTEVINLRAFGWTLATRPEPGPVLLALGLALAGAWFAGLAAARFQEDEGA